MTAQLDFWGTDDIERAFEEFDKENPHVKRELAKMALGLRARGVKRWGIAGLFEVLRYRHSIKTDGDDFKLNNNFRALYARKLMNDFQELEGLFEIRERT